jgi:hypothetical protein
MSAQRLRTLILAAPLAQACGPNASKVPAGSTSGDEVCIAQAAAAPLAGADAFEAMYGTLGSQPRLAQSFVATDEVRAVKLLLETTGPGAVDLGVRVDLARSLATGGRSVADAVLDSAFGIGGTDAEDGTSTSPDETSTLLATALVAPNALSTTPTWITVRFDASLPVAAGSTYFIALTPLYGHDSAPRVAWGYGAGSGMAAYDLESGTWNARSGLAARMAVVTSVCDE